MKQESIDQRYKMLKKHHTQTLEKAIEDKKVDPPVISFLLKVSKIPDIYTSSSCSGRIMLLSTDENENKKFSSFHCKYHRTITFDEIKQEIDSFNKGELWFKMEAFIFHFGTKDFQKARDVLSFSQSFGLKKAGIITAKDGKYILEITSTQYMSIPIKSDNQLLISDKYLKYIVNKANRKLELNFERLEKFEKSFLETFQK
jgi:tRNA wybutosine-synthesizing protein 3